MRLTKEYGQQQPISFGQYPQKVYTNGIAAALKVAIFSNAIPFAIQKLDISPMRDLYQTISKTMDSIAPEVSRAPFYIHTHRQIDVSEHSVAGMTGTKL